VGSTLEIRPIDPTGILPPRSPLVVWKLPGPGRTSPRLDSEGCTAPRRRRLFAADRGHAPRMSARFHRRRLTVTAHCGRMISAAEPRPRSPCTASRDRWKPVYSCANGLQSKSSRNATCLALACERFRASARSLCVLRRIERDRAASAQCVLEQLAGGIARERVVGELDQLGHLEAREMRRHVRAHRGFAER